MIDYFGITWGPLRSVVTNLGRAASVIAGFTMIFGYATLIIRLSRQVQRRTNAKTTYLSLIALLFLSAFIILSQVLPKGVAGTEFQLLWTYIIGYAMAGMIGTWILHPYNSIRYFRLTSVESALFIIGWFFVVAREMPVLVFLWSPLYDIGTWLEAVLLKTVMQAALASAGVGSVVLILRAFVGKEPGLIEMEVR
jgi:hypothetical protein